MIYRPDLEREIDEWINSPAGRRAMEETLVAAKASIDFITRESKVDYRDLQQPMTI